MLKPTICLNMIVRNEAHVIDEGLDSIVPFIDYWVIVDTGSDDGTQDLVRRFFAERGVPGELHERPWVDFGVNRTQALDLAAGKADYTWVFDADDVVVGWPNLEHLTADAYELRIGSDVTYWRAQLFRSRLRWVYEGRVHEYSRCLDECRPAQRLAGDYHVDSRRLGSRSFAPDKYERDAAVLEDVLRADPTDARAVFYLAQSYLSAGRFADALTNYTRRTEMGGWDEEVFIARLRQAECLERLERPWSEVLAAYLDCWQRRPSRAEPLHAIARHYRHTGEFDLCHLFASRAVAIPFPAEERLFVDVGAHGWSARDELAIAEYYLGHHEASFDLNCALLADPLLPDGERERIEGNRDFSVPFVKQRTLTYPADVVHRLATRPRRGSPQVTLTITSCRRLHLFEQTVNSFLNCCTDVESIDRFVCIDDGSSESDRDRMAQTYPFFEFLWKSPNEAGHARSMNELLSLVDTPYWLHLEDDWHFLHRAPYVDDALRILDADPSFGQVAFNRNYAETLDDRWIAGGTVYRTDRGQRLVVHEYCPTDEELAAYLASLPAGRLTNAHWPNFTLRPSLMRTAAGHGAGPFDDGDDSFEWAAARRFTGAGWRTVFFDAVVALHIGRLTANRGGTEVNAYDLNDQSQFGAAPQRARRLKVLPTGAPSQDTFDRWSRQTQGDGRWGAIQLTNGSDADYDVVADFAPTGAVTRPERTIVVQTEPATVRAEWGSWALPDPRRFVQVRHPRHFPNGPEWRLALTYAELKTLAVNKTEVLSAIVASDPSTHGYGLAVEFLREVQRSGMTVDIFGADRSVGLNNRRDRLPWNDTGAGVLPYRYTVAAEGDAEQNYVTHRLFDAILGESLCCYWGCPNVDEFVDQRAILTLPLEDPQRAVARLREAIEHDEWSKRLPVIRAEKHRLLDEEHLLPMLARIVNGHEYVAAADIEVINLDRRPDRWAGFEARARQAAGDDFVARCVRRPAVDGHALARADAVSQLVDGNSFGWSRGVIGCALSHVETWRGVAVSERPRIVFEDDVEFTPSFPGKLAEFAGSLMERSPNYDVAFLGYHHNVWSRGQRELVTHRAPRARPMAWDDYLGGTFAYLVTPRGARRLLDIVEHGGIRRAIDMFLLDHAPHLEVATCSPDICGSPVATSSDPQTDSDIQWDGEPLV
jgi:GR25 family glycosyltransferase involved in LPS biosynthesis/tetratricopeptide (TPR) repeat protein